MYPPDPSLVHEALRDLFVMHRGAGTSDRVRFRTRELFRSMNYEELSAILTISPMAGSLKPLT